LADYSIILSIKAGNLDQQAPRKSLTLTTGYQPAESSFRSTSSAKELDKDRYIVYEISYKFRSTSSAKELDQ